MGCGSSVQIALGIPATELKENALKSDSTEESPVKIHLTNRQMKLVKCSWKQVNDNYVRMGSKVFFRIFDLNPDIKMLFPFKNIWGDELLRNPLFQAHASRFMNTLSTTVSNLHMVETMVAPQLYNLGKKHAVFKGFRSDYFFLYRASILHVLQQECGKEFDEEVSESWNVLLIFITEKLREGYEKGQKLLEEEQDHALRDPH